MSIKHKDFNIPIQDDSIILLCVLKLDQRLGKTATSKLLKGISVGKNKDDGLFQLFRCDIEYQIVPVLFILNENEEVQHIHVDSWSDNYNFSAILGYWYTCT